MISWYVVSSREPKASAAPCANNVRWRLIGPFGARYIIAVRPCTSGFVCSKLSAADPIATTTTRQYYNNHVCAQGLCTAHVNLPQPPTRRLRNRGGGGDYNNTTSAARACASSPLYANVMHHRGTHIDDVSEHLGCSCATGCRVRQNISSIYAYAAPRGRVHAHTILYVYEYIVST